MLEPSLQEVAKQLKVFGGIGYKYTFQTFHDSKSKPEDARIIHSTFDDAVEELYDLNNKGHGVYISVNQTDLKGRKTENITGLRFLVLDEDKETVSKPFLKTPSMIVQSKNGRHIYWKLKPGEPLEAFRDAQVRLAKYYGTDESVKDLPRVLRLAGFWHQKNEPFLVTVLSISDLTYTIPELMQSIPDLPVKIETKYTSTIGASQDEITRFVQNVADKKDWSENNRHDSATTIAAFARKAGADYEKTLKIITKALDKSGKPFPGDEATRLVKWAFDNIEPDNVIEEEKEPTDETNIPAPQLLFKWWTAKEYAEKTPKDIPWICEPWAAAKSLTEIDGKVKTSGKTTFVCAMAKAIVDGNDFLDEPTKQTKVLYLSEAPETAWRQALQRAGLLDNENFICSTIEDILDGNKDRTVPLTWVDIIGQAIVMADFHKAGLLVIDTLSEFSNLDDEKENDSGAAKKVTDELKKAAAAGLAVIVLRHDRKGGGSTGESARGSSAYSGQMDQIVHIEEDTNLPPTQRKITLKGRIGKQFANKIVECDETTWQYTTIDASYETKQDAVRSFILKRIPETMEKAKKLHMTKKSLINVCVDQSHQNGKKYSIKQIEKVLDELIKQDIFVSSERDKNATGKPIYVFSKEVIPQSTADFMADLEK